MSVPLDQGPLKVQSQLVPSFSHAFSVCQVIYEFLPNISVIVKVALFVMSCILPKFVIFAKICYPRENLQLPTDHFSPCHLASHSLLLAKVAIFAKLSFLLKSPIVNMPLFVISFEYLAKPLMNFGILAIFAEICLYRLNLPFLYNQYLYKMPVFVVSFRFCQTFDRFFQKFVDFTKKWHFRKNPQLTTSFFCYLVLIFAKPLINSCQIGHFHQSCCSR